MPERVPLPGSERPLPAGASPAADAPALDPATRLQISVYVRAAPEAPGFDAEAEADKPPAQRLYLTAADAAVHFGADDAEIQTVADWGEGHGLAADWVLPAHRLIRFSGTATQVQSAFGVALHTVTVGGASFRSHDGPVRLPADIAELVEAVFGLDNRPLGRSFLRHARPELDTQIDAWHRAGGARAGVQLPAGSFLPPQVATLYAFPTQAAQGQKVAIFAFNDPNTPGGYTAAVLDTYFQQDLQLPAPQITDVTVLGPGNTPGDGSNPDDASPEVYLDLSIVGSLAPGAEIIVYFTEFTEQGWVDALTRASLDIEPSVISISYGNPEDGAGTAWTAAAITQVNRAFQAAAAQGRTIVVAAGDSGASDGESSGLHVDFPASSPWVLACGGTRLAGSGTTISSETVWNDLSSNEGATGGGVSSVFALPAWQANAQVPDNAISHKPGRGVPDVASLADPQTPFIVAQPGGAGGVGGTSAAAPLWATLIARLNAQPGQSPVGYLNPRLYGLSENPLRDITVGSNATAGGPGYAAGPGWDACTGWGSPDGVALSAALGTSPPSQS